MDPLVGQVLDRRYEVEGRIAVGGMATVYRAVDTRLDRLLALKVMHPSLAADPGFVDRFIREAKAVARLDHPNVVGVFDQGTDGTYVFLAMELVAGCTLRDVLRERGALQPRAALDILEPVLAALGAAHRSGLVHRDVKPENVLIGDDGRVKVADFGLVRAVDTNTTSTSAGAVLGTVSYLAPEQIEHGTVNARTDVYACGVLLYEMLTGSKPHEGGTPMQVIYKHLNEDVTAPSKAFPGLAHEMDGLVAAAAARDPERRPHDAIELLALMQATRRALTDEQLDVTPPAAGAAPTGVGTSDRTERHTTRLSRRKAAPAATPTPAMGVPAGAGTPGTPGAPGTPGGDQLNRTSRLQLPPELAHRRAEPAAFPSPPPPRRRPGPGGLAGLRARRGLVALLTVVALALGVGAAAWYIGVGRYTSTPSVLGVSKTAAERKLAGAGLEAEFNGEFSESVPKGKVVSTDPGPGGRIRGGGTVEVFLSKGPERIPVPKVEGKPLAEAKKAIQDAKFTVGRQKQAFSEEVPKGAVIRTDPVAGRRLKPDTAISLVVSKGAPVDVPDVVGLTLDEAREELSEAGLKMETVPEEVFSDEAPKGSVAEQSPEGDGQAGEGSTVRLTISKGPQLFEVPDVDGLSEDEAREELEDAGFDVRVIDVLPLLGDDKVWRQSPSGGSEEPKNATITVWIR